MMDVVHSLSRLEYAYLESWLILQTARLGILPEDLKTRVELEVQSNGNSTTRRLIVDGLPTVGEFVVTVDYPEMFPSMSLRFRWSFSPATFGWWFR